MTETPQAERRRPGPPRVFPTKAAGQHAHYEANKDEYKQRAKEWARANKWKYQKEWRKNNPEKIRRISAKARTKRRLEVLSYYSGGTLRCECCGWRPPDGTTRMLEIDHINGGGGRAAKLFGMAGTKFLSWLKTQGFPPGFRVLDAGCNRMMKAGESLCGLHGGPVP